MTYKNLAPFSDTRRMYGIYWEVEHDNHLNIWLESNPHISEEEYIHISIGSVLAFESIEESTALTRDNLRDDNFRRAVWEDKDFAVLWEVTSPFWDDVRQFYPDKQLYHYCIISSEYILNVLSEEKPIVRKFDTHEGGSFKITESEV